MTKLRRWMQTACSLCGEPYRKHTDHQPMSMSYAVLAKETGVSQSALEKLGALDREPRRGTVALIKQRYPNCPL